MNKNKDAAKKPMTDKKDVAESNDKKINEDFSGYPANPAKENMINPKTKTDRLISDTDKKPAKKTGKPILKKEHTTSKTKKKIADTDNDNVHVGSGGAFEGTEDVRD
jgi:hypothetical protein